MSCDYQIAESERSEGVYSSEALETDADAMTATAVLGRDGSEGAAVGRAERPRPERRQAAASGARRADAKRAAAGLQVPPHRIGRGGRSDQGTTLRSYLNRYSALRLGVGCTRPIGTPGRAFENPKG
jgi:hypothetical protein